MPVAEIIAIGTELLLGEIQDTNTYYLARALRDAGIDLYRTTIIGDNVQRIAKATQDAMQRSQIVLTTGGLGPTVDDPTRDAIALALGVETVFRSDLWDQIKIRYKCFGREPTENNRRQAYVPQGAISISNPVGTAPAFIMELKNNVIISLPGVPREMEYLLEKDILPYLKQKYKLHSIIKALVLHSAGIGESNIDDLIGDLETNNNPTVGLLAHPGQTDIRITAKADTISEVDRLINEMASVIRQRLGENLYGSDTETLEEIAVRELASRDWNMIVMECGLSGELQNRLLRVQFPANLVERNEMPCVPSDFFTRLEELRQLNHSDIALGVNLQPDKDRQSLSLAIITPNGSQEAEYFYGGPPENAIHWAVNYALDFLRRSLIHLNTPR